MPTVRLYANQSAWVDVNNPASNFSSGTELNLAAGQNPYIKFDLDPLNGRKLTGNAEVGYYLSSPVDSPNFPNQIFYLNLVCDDWKQETINYSNKPGTTYQSYLQYKNKGYIGWITTAISSLDWARQIVKTGISIATGSGNASVGKVRSSRSNEKPYIDVSYEAVAITVGSPSPAAGYIDDTKAQTFSWQITYDTTDVIGTVTQATAVFQWRNTATPAALNNVNVSGPAGSVTIPANTFPSTGSIEWRVQATSHDGKASNWSAWNRLSTQDTTLVSAEGLSPSFASIDGDKTNRFSWTPVSETGAAASRFQIQTSTNGVNWTILSDQSTARSYYDVPAGKFTNGVIYWRVKLWNIDGVEGAWSVTAQISVVTAPRTPSIISATNNSYTTIKWTSYNQQGFQIQIYMNRELVYDTNMRAGVQQSFKVPIALKNGMYDVQLRISDIYGQESGWAYYVMGIQTEPAFDISLEVSQIPYAAALKWQASAGPRAVYAVIRDGEAIALVQSTTGYEDYTASGMHEYFIRYEAGNNVTDSNHVTTEIQIPTRVIAPIYDPQDILECGLSTERNTFTGSSGKQKTYLHLEGRKAPVMIESDFADESMNFVYAELKPEQRKKMLQYASEGGVYIYRDNFGMTKFVSIDPVSFQRDDTMHVYALALTVIDYDDMGREAYGYIPFYTAGRQFYVADDGGRPLYVRWRKLGG